MQRFISGSSLPWVEPAASGVSEYTLPRSGKEAEKPLGKVFAKMSFARRAGGRVADEETWLF
ncbi:hypothetical protein FJV76_24890 [Mesorhizobium sp. WSM4303]|uniref:hypothetical protein n=1 Tax=unclassified Mesorhizobium TaxID=325217 RepID=UPI00115F07A9|nr:MULTISPECIES: hypothetical protein [unclassified Mesorhizobium]TRC91286.1 hypothetical protein FJV77_27070 [Mesorhizobium sp. WSM4306]TRC99287.1 hypothetical protein FJV76_24890 [Mesorhizobium sp. WSM4303]